MDICISSIPQQQSDTLGTAIATGLVEGACPIVLHKDSMNGVMIYVHPAYWIKPLAIIMALTVATKTCVHTMNLWLRLWSEYPSSFSTSSRTSFRVLWSLSLQAAIRRSLNFNNNHERPRLRVLLPFENNNAYYANKIQWCIT